MAGEMHFSSLYKFICAELQNVNLHYERRNAGILGPITLSGLNGGTRDLTKQTWSYKVCFYKMYFCKLIPNISRFGMRKELKTRIIEKLKMLIGDRS